MKEYFYALADKVLQDHQGLQLLLSFSGERSDFCRLNRAKIRQAGQVEQMYLTVRLVDDQRHVGHTFSCRGHVESDSAKVRKVVQSLQESIKIVPEDPYLLLNDKTESSEQDPSTDLTPGHDIIAGCLPMVADLDFVGIFAQGGIYNGFANSAGQRNWHACHTFNFDWSVYANTDKAMKQSYAGTSWEQKQFEHKIQYARENLPKLQRTPKVLKPGKYRVYFSPVAVQEVLDMWSWGGFSKKAQATKTAPFLKFYAGDAALSSQFTLTEDLGAGLSPKFNSDGFLLPEKVDLVRQGASTQCFVSPRSAKEYDAELNSGHSERAQAFSLAAGQLKEAEVLNSLDTGLYINNLWYLNYSDRIAGRITGMTRFACFWVENGEIKDPLAVMRFDDSLQNMFGDNLEAITKERELLLDASTYSGRSTSSYQLPGMLINDFNLVL